MEDKKRTIIRSITYRILVTILLGALSWVFTNDVYQTSAITVIYTVLATVIYYIHERAWMKVQWARKDGRKKQ